MFIDPLDKSNLLRRTSENEAMDGQGVRFRLIREERSDGAGFLGFIGAGLLLLLLL
jgi:hypothetical protein